MVNRILPDTCAWIDYFRSGRSKLGEELAEALTNDRVHVCGPVMFEITQGLKSRVEREAVMEGLTALDYLEMTESLWVKAGGLSAALRRQGKRIPMSDLLLAAIAQEHRLSILTVDKHFREIPGVAVIGV
ncbi:MAG TPA: hypothetical protein DD658_02555 [Deltaproteobacteria bacterium]|nr:hypothetical protein [Deltaproteobacteria bacterium]